MIGVVGGEPVVDLPGGACQPAAVHRPDGDAVLERAEHDEVLHDVRARQHAVDPGMLQGDEEPLEHDPPVGHRQRVAAHPDHSSGGVVGSDDEQHPVPGQRVSSDPGGHGLPDPLGLGGSESNEVTKRRVREFHCAPPATDSDDSWLR